MRPKFPISFVKAVSAASTETDSHTFETDGTIDNIFVPTYQGHGHDLRYTFEIEKSDGATRNLVESLGQSYLAGNGEVFDLDLRFPYQKGDTLHISVENTDTTYDYTANCYVQTDYEGGLFGLFARLLGRTPSKILGKN